MVLTLAARSSQQDLVASAAIRYRMLAAGLVSSAVGWPCLTGSALGAFHRVPAAAATTRRASGGGDEPVNNRRDLGWLLFGNPVSAVGDDAGGHVPAAGFA
jgi:hypothetical protein